MLHIIKSCFVCLFCWLHLVRMTFDIKVDDELQSDTFLHGLLQSWDLLSGKLVPGDRGYKCFRAISSSRTHRAFQTQ